MKLELVLAAVDGQPILTHTENVGPVQHPPKQEYLCEEPEGSSGNASQKREVTTP